MSQPPMPVERHRIYIDTSALGGCFDAEFSTWSNRLIRDFRVGRLIPVLSDATAAEVTDAPEAVRALHQEMLALEFDDPRHGETLRSLRAPGAKNEKCL